MVKKIVSKKISTSEEIQTEEIQTQAKLKKKCLFCQNNLSPVYIDVATLRRFLTDRGRITPKLRSGLCSKHQRFLTRNIKYARHLALLSFVPKV